MNFGSDTKGTECAEKSLWSYEVMKQIWCEVRSKQNLQECKAMYKRCQKKAIKNTGSVKKAIKDVCHYKDSTSAYTGLVTSVPGSLRSGSRAVILIGVRAIPLVIVDFLRGIGLLGNLSGKVLELGVKAFNK